MKAMEQCAERRKYIRFLSGEPAYGALGPRYIKVGKIKDISVGGLSFVYISTTGTDRYKESSHVNIFITDMRFHLPNVPCRVVYDVPMDSAHSEGPFKSHLSTKRCGVQFDSMTDDSANMLNYFLETYASGAIPDNRHYT